MNESKRVLTPPFRLCFPAIWQPKSFNDGPEKYSVVAVWEKAELKGRYKQEWQNVLELLNDAAKEKFNKTLAKLPDGYKRGIRNGAEKEGTEPFSDQVLFATLSSIYPPGVVDLRRQPIAETDDRVYAGCYMRASVNAYAYSNIQRGVALGLQNLQWLGHGDRLDGKRDATSDFETDPDTSWFESEGVDPDAPAETATEPADFEDDIPF